jgi:hypothetical protein
MYTTVEGGGDWWVNMDRIYRSDQLKGINLFATWLNISECFCRCSFSNGCLRQDMGWYIKQNFTTWSRHPCSSTERKPAFLPIGGLNKNIILRYEGALCYKLKDYGFETRWCQCIFSFHLMLSGRTMIWGSQPLIEMSVRSRKVMNWGSKARSVLRADSLTTICKPIA